jgi:4-amino-4-deoxy-L-arabinose transferase-like glycosyltransferase
MRPFRKAGTNMNRRYTVVALAAILLLSFAVRAGVMVYFRSYDISPEADHWDFGFETGRIARSLALGQGFSSPMPEPSGPTGFRPPGYPLLLAGIFKVWGIYTASSAVAVYLFNSLFSALTCLGLYHLGKKIFGAGVGLAAAAVFAFFPPSIWHATNTIWDTSLMGLAMVALMNGLYGLPRHPTTTQIAGLGLLMGLIALINPAPVLFFPVIAFVIWRRARQQGLRGLKEVAILTASCLLLYLPWILRNAVVLGVAAPRTSAGLNLRLGNNEGAWRMGTGTANLAIYPSNSKEEGRLFYQLGEIGYDRYCRELAMKFIRENPGKFAALTLMRMRTWWLGVGDDGAGHFKLAFRLSALKRWMSIAPLPFFVIGCLAAWRRRKPIGLVLALLLIYPIPYYFFFVAERYRFPIEPLLVLVATYGLMWMGAFRRPEANAGESVDMR